MIVSTHLSTDEAGASFSSWKEKTKGIEWRYALTGEWSTMSGTSGRRHFFYRTSPEGTYWALRVGSKIVSAAHSEEDVSVEAAVGKMMARLDADGGEWIDRVFDTATDFDLERFWSAFAGESDH